MIQFMVLVLATTAVSRDSIVSQRVALVKAAPRASVVNDTSSNLEVQISGDGDTKAQREAGVTRTMIMAEPLVVDDTSRNSSSAVANSQRGSFRAARLILQFLVLAGSCAVMIFYGAARYSEYVVSVLPESKSDVFEGAPLCGMHDASRVPMDKRTAKRFRWRELTPMFTSKLMEMTAPDKPDTVFQASGMKKWASAPACSSDPRMTRL
mmetsp:Transcript_39539/g.86284  ORF Transcript_39539/g.86284 Transcript_39539/m.86284 type:complete len:209 (-) Transcript_39539:205-831(-)